MTKYLIVAALACFISNEACAGSAATFTFADADLALWGKGKKESIDIAIRLDNPALAGKRITSVRAYVSDGDNVKPVSLWLSKDLTLKNKVNVPDISTIAPTVSGPEVVSGLTVRQMEAHLPEPYILSGDPVYIGYSIDVTSTADPADKNPVVVSSSRHSGALYIHASKSVLKWMDYASTVEGSAAIYATVEGDYGACDLGVLEIPKVYAKERDSFFVEAAVCNIGTEEVRSIDYTCTVGDFSASYHMDLTEPLSRDIAMATKVLLPIEASIDSGKYRASLSIDKVNGKRNVNVSASRDFDLTVAPFVPVRRALLEEYTGTWCGWCVFGYACLEYLRTHNPDFICAAYHNADPMETVLTFPNSVSGYPAGYIDRSQSVSFDATSAYSVSAEMTRLGQMQTPWYIEVRQEWETEDLLKAEVEIGNIEGFENGNYRLGYIFVCDGLSGSSSQWRQENNLPSQGYSRSDAYPEEVNMFCQGGVYGQAAVKGLTFNDVVISDTGIYGLEGIIPSSLEAGELIRDSRTIDLADIPLMTEADRTNIKVIAFVSDSSGKIYNCARSVPVEPAVSIKELETDSSACRYPVEYYDLSGRKISDPSKGLYIRRQGSEVSKTVL